MSRMKLRSLINLTEQAPQAPPMADPMGGAPVAAPVAPTAQPGADAAPPPAPDTSPTPEDPSEYDWTKDFREFEDAKNKAESEGKKKLLDIMNEKLMGKTIVANASRGYGQPKTDYTIEGVKKISVEFWYKDYVVIVTDANDKKYFLTPGVNIKVEQGGEAGAEQPATETPPAEDQPPTEEPNVPAPAGAGEPPAAETPAPGAPPPQASPEPEAPAAPEVPPPAPQAPAPQAPAPTPQAPPQAPPAPDDQQKKKKKKLAEWTVQHDLSLFLNDFMVDAVKNNKGVVNYVPYFHSTRKMMTESTEVGREKFLLEIPVNHMVQPLDIREVKLAAVDAIRKVTNFGQYSKGSIEINKVGRRYLVEYIKECGWVRENIPVVTEEKIPAGQWPKNHHLPEELVNLFRQQTEMSGKYDYQGMRQFAKDLQTKYFLGGSMDGDSESYSATYAFQVPKNLVYGSTEKEVERYLRSDHSGGPGQSFEHGYAKVKDKGDSWIIVMRFSGGLDI